MSERPRWIIHLPTTLTSFDEVVELTRALRVSLTHLPVIDFGETTLSEEDAQFRRTRVWCHARIGAAGGSPERPRCHQPEGHPGPCRADP